MSSKQRVTEDAKMRTNIIHSKAGVSTTERTAVLTWIHFLPNLVEMQTLMQVHLEQYLKLKALREIRNRK